MAAAIDKIALLAEIKANAIGTGGYYRISPFSGLVCTDGVKVYCDAAECWWLLNVIASFNTVDFLREHSFQLWEINVRNRRAVVTCRTDAGEPDLVRQEVPYTDFPLDYEKFYCCDGVVMLPGEY